MAVDTISAAFLAMALSTRSDTTPGARWNAWAITPEALNNILAIAERRNDVTPEAVEAYRAEHVPTAEWLQMRDASAGGGSSIWLY